MPLVAAIIENFQSHKSTSLEFSPGVNIIWGPSDHGKSSIIRAIRWVAINKPKGDEFRRHGTDKTQVLLENNNFIVQRRRSDSKNEYETDDQIYKALRTAVPEDISSALNLDSTNIQPQHEVYFLADKSPSQRSKVLNEVAGLEIMDKAFKKVNSDIRSVNSDIRAVNKQLKEVQSDILDLEYIEKADVFLTKLENYQRELQSKRDLHENITDLIESINELEEEKSKFMSDECLSAIQVFLRKEIQLENLRYHYEKLSGTLSMTKNLERELSSIPVIDVTELEKMQHTINSLMNKQERVQDVVREIQFQNKCYKQIELTIAQTENSFLAELKRLGKCPTCGVVV